MSPLTRYLSCLLGVTLLVVATAELTQPAVMAALVPAFLQQPGLLFLGGLITLVSGLAIVVGHNLWSNPAAAVISALGWLTTLKGATLLLVPASAWQAMLTALHYPSHSGVYAILPICAGGYLTYAGFSRRP